VSHCLEVLCHVRSPLSPSPGPWTPENAYSNILQLNFDRIASWAGWQVACLTPLVGSGLNHTLSPSVYVSRSCSPSPQHRAHICGPGLHVNQSAACSACALSAPQHIYPQLPATITAVLVLRRVELNTVCSTNVMQILYAPRMPWAIWYVGSTKCNVIFHVFTAARIKYIVCKQIRRAIKKAWTDANTLNTHTRVFVYSPYSMTRTSRVHEEGTSTTYFQSFIVNVIELTTEHTGPTVHDIHQRWESKTNRWQQNSRIWFLNHHNVTQWTKVPRCCEDKTSHDKEWWEKCVLSIRLKDVVINVCIQQQEWGSCIVPSVYEWTCTVSVLCCKAGLHFCTFCATFVTHLPLISSTISQPFR